jgi:hypothetical protein
VLDRLGRARKFLQIIMKFGVIASEVRLISSLEIVAKKKLDLQGYSLKAHPIAKAVFGCVNIVYEVGKPKTRILDRWRLILLFLYCPVAETGESGAS